MVWFFVAAVMAFLVIEGAYYVYCVGFYNANAGKDDIFAPTPGKQHAQFRDQIVQNINSLLEQPCEEVYITSHDGLRLTGRYYHRQDGAPVQIQFHGYRGNSIREYAATFRMSEKLGGNTLVPDMRAHGESEGHVISFGVEERYDCADWVKYVTGRFGAQTQIVLSGASMGAATVLMASDLVQGSSVKGIIADCPFSSPRAIMEKVCAMVHLPGRIAYPFAVLGALLFGRFKLWQSSALRSVQHTQIPILLIHGKADKLVPYRMSEEIFSCCASDKELMLVSGAGHCLSYYVDPEGYFKALKGVAELCGLKTQ